MSAPSSPSAAAANVIVDDAAMGQRLDAWLSKRLELPRGRIGRALKAGHVFVTTTGGKKSVCKKPATKLKTPWLHASVEFSEPCLEPTRYLPEDLGIAARVMYEDEFLMVLDKPAGMTVHPAKGLISGTLVNALLHHWGRPAIECTDVEDEGEGEGGDDRTGATPTPSASNSAALLSSGNSNSNVSHLDTSNDKNTIARRRDLHCRPGIVHRLDRHTSGCMVYRYSSHTKPNSCARIILCIFYIYR